MSDQEEYPPDKAPEGTMVREPEDPAPEFPLPTEGPYIDEATARRRAERTAKGLCPVSAQHVAIPGSSFCWYCNIRVR